MGQHALRVTEVTGSPSGSRHRDAESQRYMTSGGDTARRLGAVAPVENSAWWKAVCARGAFDCVAGGRARSGSLDHRGAPVYARQARAPLETRPGQLFVRAVRSIIEFVFRVFRDNAIEVMNGSADAGPDCDKTTKAQPEPPPARAHIMHACTPTRDTRLCGAVSVRLLRVGVARMWGVRCADFAPPPRHRRSARRDIRPDRGARTGPPHAARCAACRGGPPWSARVACRVAGAWVHVRS